MESKASEEEGDSASEDEGDDGSALESLASHETASVVSLLHIHIDGGLVMALVVHVASVLGRELHQLNGDTSLLHSRSQPENAEPLKQVMSLCMWLSALSFTQEDLGQAASRQQGKRGWYCWQAG